MRADLCWRGGQSAEGGGVAADARVAQGGGAERRAHHRKRPAPLRVLGSAQTEEPASAAWGQGMLYGGEEARGEWEMERG